MVCFYLSSRPSFITQHGRQLCLVAKKVSVIALSGATQRLSPLLQVYLHGSPRHSSSNRPRAENHRSPWILLVLHTSHVSRARIAVWVGKQHICSLARVAAPASTVARPVVVSIGHATAARLASVLMALWVLSAVRRQAMAVWAVVRSRASLPRGVVSGARAAVGVCSRGRRLVDAVRLTSWRNCSAHFSGHSASGRGEHI